MRRGGRSPASRITIASADGEINSTRVDFSQEPSKTDVSIAMNIDMPEIATVTVKQLQNTPRHVLVSWSMEALNRQFSLACSLMVQAMDAFAMGDRDTAVQFGRKAATALTRAQEDNVGQVRRVERTAAAISEKL